MKATLSILFCISTFTMAMSAETVNIVLILSFIVFLISFIGLVRIQDKAIKKALNEDEE